MPQQAARADSSYSTCWAAFVDCVKSLKYLKGKQMKLSQHQRIEVAVYIIIISFAVIIAAISTTLRDIPQQLGLNISADFIGVAVLYFLVNRFFGLNPEKVISKRTEMLFDLIEQKHQVLIDSKEAQKKLTDENLLQSAEELDVLGYTLVGFLGSFRGAVIERVKQGAQVRVLIVDPKSIAGEVIRQNSMAYPYEHYVVAALDHIRYIRDKLSESEKRIKGSFELRVINWIPSCALIIVDRSKQSGMIDVAVNTPYYRTLPSEGRLHYILEREQEPRWFLFYSQQFDRLWEGSQHWNDVQQ
jgi:hypothetical protein